MVRFVDAYDRQALTVFGEYRTFLEPGDIIPRFVSRTYTFDMRIQTMDVLRQESITRDNHRDSRCRRLSPCDRCKAGVPGIRRLRDGRLVILSKLRIGLYSVIWPEVGTGADGCDGGMEIESET